RQSADRRHRLHRARHSRRHVGRADCEVRARDVLRQKRRPSASDPDEARRDDVRSTAAAGRSAGDGRGPLGAAFGRTSKFELRSSKFAPRGAQMIVERRLSAHLDWPLVLAVLALTVVGLATIYSVTWNFRANQPGSEFWMQVYAVPVGLVAMFL